MFIHILFYLLSLINILALKDVYWPLFKDHVNALIALHAISKCWQITLIYIIVIVKTSLRKIYNEKIIKLKQWWHETALYIGNDKYLLVHYIKNEKVKIIIKRNKDEITAIVDDSYDECYIDEAKPFFLYSQEDFHPEILGIKKSIIIHRESGKSQKI